MTMLKTQLTLDHVGLVVVDLEHARKSYDRMGFNLSSLSSHKGKRSPDGPIELWGTGNHCAMFANGYFEILGVTDKNRHHQSVQLLVDEYAGLHLIALGCSDAEFAAEQLRSRLGGDGAHYSVSRDVPTIDGGTQTAAFDILQLPEDSFPEADLFLIEHKNKEIIWQPDTLSQPNGVVGLSAVTVCVADVENSGQRLSRALEIQPSRTEGVLVFELARGAIRIISPDELQRQYPGVSYPKIPWVASMEFEVADIDVTRLFLKKNDFTLKSIGSHAVWVGPDQADGAVVVFSQTA